MLWSIVLCLVIACAALYQRLRQAEQKLEDLNATDLDNAARMIAGTARSMGLTVTGAPIVD